MEKKCCVGITEACELKATRVQSMKENTTKSVGNQMVETHMQDLGISVLRTNYKLSAHKNQEELGHLI